MPHAAALLVTAANAAGLWCRRCTVVDADCVEGALEGATALAGGRCPDQAPPRRPAARHPPARLHAGVNTAGVRHCAVPARRPGGLLLQPRGQCCGPVPAERVRAPGGRSAAVAPAARGPSVHVWTCCCHPRCTRTAVLWLVLSRHRHSVSPCKVAGGSAAGLAAGAWGGAMRADLAVTRPPWLYGGRWERGGRSAGRGEACAGGEREAAQARAHCAVRRRPGLGCGQRRWKRQGRRSGDMPPWRQSPTAGARRWPPGRPASAPCKLCDLGEPASERSGRGGAPSRQSLSPRRPRSL